MYNQISLQSYLKDVNRKKRKFLNSINTKTVEENYIGSKCVPSPRFLFQLLLPWFQLLLLRLRLRLLFLLLLRMQLLLPILLLFLLMLSRFGPTV